MAIADMMQAINWLNHQSRTDIEQMSRFWIEHIQDPDLTEEEKKEIIRSLAGSIRNIAKTHEKAEILANCGAYGYQLGMDQDALTWLDQAEKLYIEDVHRQGVTNWMQFIVHRSAGRLQPAVEKARRAIRLFFDLANQSLARKQHEIESWYRGRLIDMTCDLIDTPEVAFELLFFVPDTFLKPSSAQIKARIVESLVKGDTEKALDEMQLLLGISAKASKPEETGEALGFCGTIHWRLNDHPEAIRFFRAAMTQFIPGSHAHVLLRWMLGLALFERAKERYEAIQLMEACLGDIDRLRQKAVQNNQENDAGLYEVYHLAMRRVLGLKISNQG